MLRRLCIEWTKQFNALTLKRCIGPYVHVGQNSKVIIPNRSQHSFCKTYRHSQKCGYHVTKHRNVSTGKTPRKGVLFKISQNLVKIRNIVFRPKSSSPTIDGSQSAATRKVPTTEEIRKLLSFAKSEKWKLLGKT